LRYFYGSAVSFLILLAELPYSYRTDGLSPNLRDAIYYNFSFWVLFVPVKGFFGCIYCLLVLSLYKSSLKFTAEDDRLVGAKENDDYDETNPNDWRATHVVVGLIVFFCVHASLR